MTRIAAPASRRSPWHSSVPIATAFCRRMPAARRRPFVPAAKLDCLPTRCGPSPADRRRRRMASTAPRDDARNQWTTLLAILGALMALIAVGTAIYIQLSTSVRAAVTPTSSKASRTGAADFAEPPRRRRAARWSAGCRRAATSSARSTSPICGRTRPRSRRSCRTTDRSGSSRS